MNAGGYAANPSRISQPALAYERILGHRRLFLPPIRHCCCDLPPIALPSRRQPLTLTARGLGINTCFIERCVALNRISARSDQYTTAPHTENLTTGRSNMPAQARRWAAECFERALNKELHPMSRMLLIDTAEAWIRLADRLEASSGPMSDFDVDHERSYVLH